MLNMTNTIGNRNALSLLKDVCDLNTKISHPELAAFIIALICCYIIAELVSEIVCDKIEKKQNKTHAGLMTDLNYLNEEVQELLKENLKLKKELQEMKENKATIQAKKMIQCDKCYNEYDKINIQKCYIVQHIMQQYCLECYQKQKTNLISRSQSDSNLRLIR